MKKMRIPLYIALGLAILGVVLGSFFDLQISTAIANPRSGLGLTISAIGPTLGFAGVAIMGGGLIAYARKEYPIGLKILFIILAAACYGVAIFYPGAEYFGENGFYWAAPKFVGYLIVALPEAGMVVLGYFLFRNCENKNMWIVFCIIIGLLLIALLAVIPTLKDNMHRPRYRLISTTDAVIFHNWYQPCKNYKDLIAQYDLSKEDFKSFPSGHTAESSILLVTSVFFPLASKKFEKYQLFAFIGSFLLVVIVGLGRIMAAAHFLSDVSMGATVTLLLLTIANEVVIRIKPLHIEEQNQVQE